MLKYTIILFAALSFFSSKAAGERLRHVEKTYYLKGAVGERTIAIKMLCYDEFPTRYINYFFPDAKKDRQLAGVQQGNSWHFVPEESVAATAVALSITETTNGDWTGTWKDSSGKIWNLVLKPIETETDASTYSHLPFADELDPYERYRLLTIQLTKERTETPAKNILIDWYLEQESGISLFRMRSENKRLKTDSVNLALEALHFSLLLKHFSYNPELLSSEFETTIHYLTPEVLSFRIRATSTLRTMEKVQVSEPVTLDMKSGQQVKLEDVLWFGQANQKPASDDLFKIFKYRKSTFAPKVFQLLQELYPDNMKTDICNINQPESWALPVWSLTSKGIAFGLTTAVGCTELDWAVIPYEKLTPFLIDSYSLKKNKQ